LDAENADPADSKREICVVSVNQRPANGGDQVGSILIVNPVNDFY
jgi:hypothetical protein